MLANAIVRARLEQQADAAARLKVARNALRASIRLMGARADIALAKRGRALRAMSSIPSDDVLGAEIEALSRRIRIVASGEGAEDGGGSPARDLLALLERRF